MRDSFRADLMWLTGHYKKFGTDRSCMKRRSELKIFFSYSFLAEASGVRGRGGGLVFQSAGSHLCLICFLHLLWLHQSNVHLFSGKVDRNFSFTAETK